MSTMRKTKGSGVMPAVMTFWNADESFNQKETERYIQWVLDCGAHSLSVTGSTGENISMSDDEQKKIIECLVKFVDHQVPVYPGTGKYGTAQTIEMTKFAQKCGAEGALVIMPYYLIPHKRAVVNHFKKLREAVGDDFDIILYNNPRFCGYQFEPIELKELAEQGIINGVKLADGRASYIQGMKHYCPDGITALYGHDYEPLPAFFAGADGWLSGLPGIFPKFCVDLFNLCTVQQDAPAARKLWDKMQDFIDYFITYSNNDPHWHEVFKYVLKCFGFDAGLPRMPLGDLLPEEKKKVDALLADMDVTIKATNLIKYVITFLTPRAGGSDPASPARGIPLAGNDPRPHYQEISRE